MKLATPPSDVSTTILTTKLNIAFTSYAYRRPGDLGQSILRSRGRRTAHFSSTQKRLRRNGVAMSTTPHVSCQTLAGLRPPRTLLIEGWRGVNHSFAMVNQYQILEMLKIDGLRLFHHDLPFAFDHWDRKINRAGFSAQDQSRIDGISSPDDTPIDHLYRIVSPFRAPERGRPVRTTNFLITELGLSTASFSEGSNHPDLFTGNGNSVVTTSHWARDRIVEYGFAASHVHVVPLGVDTAAFHPLDAADRLRARLQLGITEDDVIFLNVGVALWNKGIDVLLRAFATLRANGRRVRLMLKDQRDVYGVTVEQTIRNLLPFVHELLDPATLAAISVIPGNLTREQLRHLYGIADCYVSPYRAEGFNLPVIEAVACGTPVIVTRGGATDDFCDDDVACRISGCSGQHENAESGYVGRFIEPNVDELISAMDGFAVGSGIDMPRFQVARASLIERFSWASAAQALLELTFGTGGEDTHAQRDNLDSHAPAIPAARKIGQRDILDLLAMLRPLAMAHGGKIRIGGAHDGGYVVPDAARACRVVLSIGINNDVSFDLELAELGAQVLQFDHKVESVPVAHANFHFHRRGWGTVTAGPYLDFAAMNAELKTLEGSKKLLKFDIEGAEYAALESIDGEVLSEFSVIVCAIHNLSKLLDAEFFSQVHRCLAKLTLFHAPVHVHANNYGAVVLIEGVPIPDVIEISFLRRDLNVFTGPSLEPIPGPLDNANCPGIPDLCLTAFYPAYCEPRADTHAEHRGRAHNP